MPMDHRPPTVNRPTEPPNLEIGTRIDFGDSGIGTITAKDAEAGRVFVESLVFTGWTDERWLRSVMRPNVDD
jgi:hypothetical protein